MELIVSGVVHEVKIFESRVGGVWLAFEHGDRVAVAGTEAEAKVAAVRRIKSS